MLAKKHQDIWLWNETLGERGFSSCLFRINQQPEFEIVLSVLFVFGLLVLKISEISTLQNINVFLLVFFFVLSGILLNGKCVRQAIVEAIRPLLSEYLWNSFLDFLIFFYGCFYLLFKVYIPTDKCVYKLALYQ